jgi:hypothetical protein
VTVAVNVAEVAVVVGGGHDDDVVDVCVKKSVLSNDEDKFY